MSNERADLSEPHLPDSLSQGIETEANEDHQEARERKRPRLEPEEPSQPTDEHTQDRPSCGEDNAAEEVDPITLMYAAASAAGDEDSANLLATSYQNPLVQLPNPFAFLLPPQAQLLLQPLQSQAMLVQSRATLMSPQTTMVQPQATQTKPQETQTDGQDSSTQPQETPTQPRETSTQSLLNNNQKQQLVQQPIQPVASTADLVAQSDKVIKQQIAVLAGLKRNQDLKRELMADLAVREHSLQPFMQLNQPPLIVPYGYSAIDLLAPQPENKSNSTGKSTSTARLLFADKDPWTLSQYQCLLRQQIEIFEVAGNDDRLHGRNKPVVVGQIGIRCKHCSGLPMRHRAAAATFYPAKLSGVYPAAQTMALHHIQVCSHVPDTVQRDMEEKQVRKSSPGGGRAYWERSLTELGIVQEKGFLRFGTSSKSASETDTI